MAGGLRRQTVHHPSGCVQNYPTRLLLDAHGNLLASQIGSMPIEYIRPSNGPAQPGKAESEKLQLKWLDHWVASTVANAHSH